MVRRSVSGNADLTSSNRRQIVGGTQGIDGPLGVGLREQEVGEGQVAHRLTEATPHEAASIEREPLGMFTGTPDR